MSESTCKCTLIIHNRLLVLSHLFCVEGGREGGSGICIFYHYNLTVYESRVVFSYCA